jgi:hypothetical protein
MYERMHYSSATQRMWHATKAPIMTVRGYLMCRLDRGTVLCIEGTCTMLLPCRGTLMTPTHFGNSACKRGSGGEGVQLERMNHSL